MNYLKKFLFLLAYYSGLIGVTDLLYYKIFKGIHVPVLVYHSISDNIYSYGNEIGLSIRKEVFEEQIKYLKSRFTIVPFSEVSNCIHNYTEFKKSPISITFDDGYCDNYTNAYPILRKYQSPATVFLTSGNINSKRQIDWYNQDFLSRHKEGYEDFKANSMLSSDDIVKMKVDGIEFGAHTKTHPVLSGLSSDEQSIEIMDSIKEIEGLIKTPVKTFAYPFGGAKTFTDETISILKGLGIEIAAVSYGGFNNLKTDRYKLRRIIIIDEPLYIFKARLSVFNIFIKGLW
ncbi:MAG: polysaccharide deacetylase family protein [Nitrospirae bacterium]|nr:polysaccharide deacetylase family protein [Nitrospirota bacterium]